MSFTINELFKYYISTDECLIEENICQISLYKLIYVYLNQPKCLSCLDLMPVVLARSRNHFHYFRTKFYHYELDIDSSTGQRIRLDCDIKTLELGMKRTFKSILPGIYQIVCRIKLDKNEKYLFCYEKGCREDSRMEKSVQCNFYAYMVST